MKEKLNREFQKWGNKKLFDQNYDKIFPPCICGGKGYFEDYCPEQKKLIKTTCLLCNGRGKRKIKEM